MSTSKQCPLCDSTGPWPSHAARTAHIRAHHTADCPVCGDPVNAMGLAAHMRILHPREADNPTPPEDVVDEQLVDVDEGRPGEEEPATSGDAGSPPSSEGGEPENMPENMPADAEHAAPEAAAPAALLGAVMAYAAAPPQVDQSDLVCPECEATFATVKGLKAHRRSHQVVECDTCGRQVKANGLGPHMRAHRRAAGGSTVDPPPAAADLAQVVAGGPAPTPAPPRVEPKAKVECPDCGEMIRSAGIGNHRRKHRREQQRDAVARGEDPARVPRGADVLAELAPGVAGEVLDRIAELIESHEDAGAGGRWVVAPLAGDGPARLCRRDGIGLVAAREHHGVVVVSVDDVLLLSRPAAVAS